MWSIAGALALGIYCGDFLPLSPGIVGAGLLLCWLGCVSSIRIRVRTLPALIVLLGVFLQRVELVCMAPSDLRRVTSESPSWVRVRGWLRDRPYERTFESRGREVGRTSVPMEVAWIQSIRDSNHARPAGSDASSGSEWRRASGWIWVTGPSGLPPDFHRDQAVELEGVLAVPPMAIADGLFDDREFLGRQGMHRILRTSSAGDWSFWPGGGVVTGLPLEDRFEVWARAALARGLPVEDEPLRLSWAMALGWKTALTPAVTQPFLQTGTLHIFAISGLHVALIAEVLVQLLKLIRIPRRRCGWVVIPALWFYTLATGWQASAIRSTVMMTLIVWGWMMARPTDVLNSLGLAAVLILSADPQQLFQASFQLSFLVVASLALGVGRVSPWIQDWTAGDPFLPDRLRPWWWHPWQVVARWFLGGLTTSGVAWLGSLALSVHLFHMITPVSLIANLAVVPLSSLALTCQLGSLLTAEWCPWACECFNHSGWLWMNLMIRITHILVKPPGAFFWVPSPGLVCLGLVQLSLFVLVLDRLTTSLRWKLAAALFAAGILGMGAQWFGTATRTEWVLFQSDRGVAAIVDGPGRSADVCIEAGTPELVSRSVVPYLHSRGFQSMPRLALLRASAAHCAGAFELAEQMRIPEVWTSTASTRSATFRHVIGELRQNHKVRAMERGTTEGRWAVLHPGSPPFTGKKFITTADDTSMVLRWSGAVGSVLVCLGCSPHAQVSLVESGLNLSADVVIASMPTRGEPLGDALLDRVQPRWVLWMEPAGVVSMRVPSSVNARLVQRGLRVLSTAEDGSLTLSFGRRGATISKQGDVIPVPGVGWRLRHPERVLAAGG